MTYLLPEQPDKEEPALEEKEASFRQRRELVDLAVGVNRCEGEATLGIV